VIQAPGVTVNGVAITPEQIGAEVQYHPSENLPDAKYRAMQALVIRELLLQKASSKNNKGKFHTAPLFEASHIFYPALPQDCEARDSAFDRAKASLKKIKDNPDLFESIARAESACSSAQMGGFLGQISKGQTVPAFEKALMLMAEGDVSSEPVETEVGYHIIHVHKRANGKPLPAETAAKWVSDYLKRESWQRAFKQYIQILAGESEISGFRLKASETPLVQ